MMKRMAKDFDINIDEPVAGADGEAAADGAAAETANGDSNGADAKVFFWYSSHCFLLSI